MTDRDLLNQLHNCPNDAVAALSERYAPLAASIARRILPNREQDVEEIAADVLIKLWRAGDSLRAETLRGFVITTARNLAVDRWRLLRRRMEVPLFDSDEGDSAFLEREVLGNVLAEQIKALSPPDGEIFLRHYLLLETAAEIGARFGLTESAVKSRLHRMRKVLREEVPL